MSTFCISDLHACDRGYRDNFSVEGRESCFHKFLDFVESREGRLYILGDLFDFWQVNLSKAVVTYSDLLDRLDDMEAVYVVGNHDGALSHFINTPMMLGHRFFKRMRHAFEETIGGRRFAFLHGHEADPYCRDDKPGTGEITAIISGLLEDRNKNPFRKGHAVEDLFVGTLERALTLWRKLTLRHGRLDEMLDGVEAYRKQKSADVVVYGHTHEPGQIGDYHFNTGSWARARNTFVCIDDEKGEAKMWEWVDTRPVPYLWVLRNVSI